MFPCMHAWMHTHIHTYIIYIMKRVRVSYRELQLVVCSFLEKKRKTHTLPIYHECYIRQLLASIIWIVV